MWMQTAATGKGTKSGCKYNFYRRRDKASGKDG